MIPHPVQISVIVPTLNEGEVIGACIEAVRLACGNDTEIIVVDGGSLDQTIVVAREKGGTVVSAERGRARQMNVGAAMARGNVLLFLHADTCLPTSSGGLVSCVFERADAGWGRFDVRMASDQLLLRLVAALMNVRSRLTGIATGDQAIFVRRDWFEQLGGFPEIPLMEDVAFSRALKRLGPPKCLSARVTTSARRWQSRGVLRTILLMWKIRWLYYWGTSPDRLSQLYGGWERDD